MTSSRLMILDLLPNNDNKSKIIGWVRVLSLNQAEVPSQAPTWDSAGRDRKDRGRGGSDFEDGRHEHGSATVGLVDPTADGPPDDVFEGICVANAVRHRLLDRGDELGPYGIE